MNLTRYIFLVFSLVVLSGCTTGRDLVRDDTVTIQPIDSRYAYIKSISIKQFDKEIALAGVVKLRHSGRGIVHDHVDVKVSAPNGGVIYENEVLYHHLNIKKGEANFRVTLNKELQSGSLMQLSLQNVSEHE